MKRIAIQGELGSFHDITAHQYFEGEQIEIICCATFEEVFENIKRDPTVVGICAIENTIAGSLLHNYELLRQSGTTVAFSGIAAAEPLRFIWEVPGGGRLIPPLKVQRNEVIVNYRWRTKKLRAREYV